MTNTEMKSGRFLKMQKGRRIFAAMNAAWDAGRVVNVGNALRVSVIKANARALITLGRSGSLYMARGKTRDCIDFCRIWAE